MTSPHIAFTANPISLRSGSTLHVPSRTQVAFDSSHRRYLECPYSYDTRRQENCDRWSEEWLARAVPGAATASAGRRLPTARVAQRGRRRAPGGLAAGQPRRYQRGREPGRVVHDGRGPGVVEHAPRAEGKARRAARGRGTRPGREPAGRGRSRAAGLDRRLGRAGVARGAEALPPAERLAYVLHDMFAVPFDEIASVTDRSPPQPVSWRAGPDAACKARRGFPTPTSTGSGASSTRSPPPAGTATLPRCSRCSIRTSCCATTTEEGRPRGRHPRGARSRRPGADVLAMSLYARLVLVNGAPGVVVLPEGQDRPFALMAFTVMRGGSWRST